MPRTTWGSSPAGGPAPHPTVMAIASPKSERPASPKEEESLLLQLAHRKLTMEELQSQASPVKVHHWMIKKN